MEQEQDQQPPSLEEARNNKNNKENVAPTMINSFSKKDIISLEGDILLLVALFTKKIYLFINIFFIFYQYLP